MKITNVTMKDLPNILRIEKLGFNEQEAGTEQQYRDRIEQLKDTFLVAKDGDKLVGFVVGPITSQEYVEDWMYQNTPQSIAEGGNQIIFTIAVDPDYQGQHVGSQLLEAIEKLARQHHRQSISLTSLEKNLPFYLKKWFRKSRCCRIKTRW